MGYSEGLTLGEWIGLTIVIVWGIVFGLLLLFRTDEALRSAARIQLRMRGIFGGTMEDLPSKRREHMRKLLESSGETGDPNRCIIRFAGCGHLVVAILFILAAIAILIST